DTVVFQSLDSCGQVTFAGQVFTGDTVLYDTLQYANIDCDSLYAQVNIIVHAPSESVLDTTICEGAWVNLGGQVFDTTGVFVVNLETVDGCDSIITLHLAGNPAVYDSLTAAICQGGSYNFNGQILNAAGIYVDTFTARGNCDSIVVLDLAVNPAVYDSLTAAICQGGSYNFNGQILNAAGIYVDTFTATGNCDSIVVLDLAVNPAVYDSLTAAIC